jgi:SH3 domain protein
MRRGLLILLLLLPVAAVQGAHITDKLLAGLYEKPDSTNDPISLLPSGTPLEILSRQGGYARVRLGDDQTGWVEARFISKEKPAKARLLEAQAKNAELQRQLVEAQARLRLYKDDRGALSAGQAAVSAGPSPAPPQSQAGPGNNGEPRRVADLERQLETARREAERQIGLEQKRSAVLEAENRRLREHQEEVAAMLADKSASGRSGDWRPWHVSLLAALLLLSFVAGIAFKNYRIYRRYGKHRL